MSTQYNNNETVTGILSDLISIHNDRISGYGQAIVKVTDIEPDLKYTFEDIVVKGGKYKMQLSEKMKGLDNNGKKGIIVPGKIYSAWKDLKMTFNGNTRKAIISYCQYNEDIAQYAYEAALNLHVDMNSDIRLLMEDQQSDLHQTYIQLKKYREEQHFSLNPRLIYFQ